MQTQINDFLKYVASGKPVGDVAMCLPMNLVIFVGPKWHRSEWFQRCAVLGLGVVAAHNAGIKCVDLLDELAQVSSERMERNRKEVNDRARKVEDEIVSRIGHMVEIQLRQPPLKITARCGNIETYQVMEGDIWEIRHRVLGRHD